MTVRDPRVPSSPLRSGLRISGRIILYLLAVLLAIVFAIPAYWTMVGSFKTVAEIRHIPPIWVPSTWHYENFSQVWQTVPFGTFYKNTIIVTGLATFGQVFSAAVVG